MSKQSVLITNDLNKELTTILHSITYDKAFILTDQHTRKWCLPKVQDVQAIKEATVIEIEAGDIHKDISQLAKIWKTLSDNGASRRSLLINLGGGMVTDIGGFAGATFKRGLTTINIPTTLMASVDAAVGGKTGINFNGLKNEIGAFYPPAYVLIDCNFLQTLDTQNILSGYAEMLKHGLISSDKILYSLLSTDPHQITDYDAFNRLIANSVSVKEEIVKQDPTEKGIRKALNFGHTVGHAFESLSFKKNQPLLHGHAVAIGLVCELFLSHRHRGFPTKALTDTVTYIKEYYPTFMFDCSDYESLYELMTHDKKNTDGIINFTLLADIGDIRLDQTLKKEDIFNSFDFYRDRFGI